MTIDRQDEKVIKDAVTLGKTDFVDLYVRLKHERIEASVAWHTVRSSPKGQALREKLAKGLPAVNSASSFIGDMDAEVEERTKTNKKMKNKTKVETPVEVIEEAFLPEEDAALADTPTPAKERKSKDSNKEAKAQSLIASGVVKAKDLAEQGNFSLPYAYLMLKKYK